MIRRVIKYYFKKLQNLLLNLAFGLVILFLIYIGNQTSLEIFIHGIPMNLQSPLVVLTTTVIGILTTFVDKTTGHPADSLLNEIIDLLREAAQTQFLATQLGVDR